MTLREKGNWAIFADIRKARGAEKRKMELTGLTRSSTREVRGKDGKKKGGPLIQTQILRNQIRRYGLSWKDHYGDQIS